MELKAGWGRGKNKKGIMGRWYYKTSAVLHHHHLLHRPDVHMAATHNTAYQGQHNHYQGQSDGYKVFTNVQTNMANDCREVDVILPDRKK